MVNSLHPHLTKEGGEDTRVRMQIYGELLLRHGEEAVVEVVEGEVAVEVEGEVEEGEEELQDRGEEVRRTGDNIC